MLNLLMELGRIRLLAFLFLILTHRVSGDGYV